MPPAVERPLPRQSCPYTILRRVLLSPATEGTVALALLVILETVFDPSPTIAEPLARGLLFGGALAGSMFGLAAFVWSDSFPPIRYGHAARALYLATSSSELWLYITSLGLFLLGGFGLYLLAKVPQLIKQSFH